MSRQKAKQMNQKTKQIRDFSSKSIDEKWDALSRPERPCYNPAFYDNAVDLRATLYAGYYLLTERREISKADRDKAAQNFAIALVQLLKRFLDGYKRKDGSFFRAMADALDRNGNPAWSKREKFIFGACIACEAMGQPLPSASQLLKAWKINCGVLPDCPADLRYLWNYVHPNEPLPKSGKMKEILARDFPMTDVSAECLQHLQIQREARNVGYKLPRQKGRNALPIGICPVEISNAVF
jgi:hypothetical protein